MSVEEGWRLAAAAAVQCTTALEALFSLAVLDEPPPMLWDEEATELRRHSQIVAAVEVKRARELAAELVAFVDRIRESDRSPRGEI